MTAQLMRPRRLHRRRPRRRRPDHRARCAAAWPRPTSCCSMPSPTPRCASWRRRRRMDRRRQARLLPFDRAGRRSTRCWCGWRSATRVVVRLKGGDPSLFGRLEEELAALARRRHRRARSCPASPPALAAAAATQRPLTAAAAAAASASTTAMTREGRLRAGRTRRHRGLLHGRPPARRARRAGCSPPAGRPTRRCCVVSRAGWPDELGSRPHGGRRWPTPAVLHAGRPTVVDRRRRRRRWRSRARTCRQ
ncbi:MAG: SAM-dependent methyltransferase [Comamonadaceae bacterium]|nr:SAM-dependent methyltransferase [Comamonadaceae bacterium]